MTHPTPIALTIAGSDSGGGAGIQADLKTFEAFGVFGTSVLTAVTAQNTLGVTAVHPIPSEVVRAQLDAVAADLRPSAVKTGMLASAELISAVSEGLAAHDLAPVVVDPVMVATSGDRLLDPGAESALREQLIPRSALVTPNLPEAEILTGLEVRDESGMERAARAIVEMGAGAVLLKGGHLDTPRLVDLLGDRGRPGPGTHADRGGGAGAGLPRTRPPGCTRAGLRRWPASSPRSDRLIRRADHPWR